MSFYTQVCKRQNNKVDPIVVNQFTTPVIRNTCRLTPTKDRRSNIQLEPAYWGNLILGAPPLLGTGINHF